ncbi:alpha/beta fold hydrolase [Zavarzinia sp.]|uniref:alpha/beta fold hydrolase n=1 Tax=Zavarzinia sp. TaxID=2027920 RepID=UPI003565CF4D
MSDEARRREMPPGGAFASFERGGVRLRTASWPGTRGTIVLVTGRNEFIEKYFETIADLTGRGFTVHMMDWRGQGLSDRLLPDRMKGHVGDFADYGTDLEAFVERAAGPGPLLLMGHSMGGHVILRALATSAALRRNVAGAVLSAAMMEIDTGRVPSVWAGRLARFAVLLGRATIAVPAPKESGAGFNLLTSDPERGADQAWFVAREPKLDLGAPTFGWLDAAFRSIALLQTPGRLETVETPVLVAVAGADKVVRPEAERRAAARLKHATLAEIDGSRHEILKERDVIRAAFWSAFDLWCSGLTAG